jgi:adenosylcobinamide kinase / adenosylcobinamide-phosphate guanylyltransferase
VKSRRVLLLGGARCGKSEAAETRAAKVAKGEPVVYVATAPSRADDPEWTSRLIAHRARRPAHWRTVETADPILHLANDTGVVLIDCLALWLTRAMDEIGVWDAAEAALRTGWARAALDARVSELVGAWRAAPGYVIAVSNEVGMGVVPAETSGRRFRDELGRLNIAMAAASDEVNLVVAGRLLPLEP